MTEADLFAVPEGERFHELLGGELVQKAAPSADHAAAQAGALVSLGPPFQRPPGRGGPGGWWFLTEVEVRLASGDVIRPDLAGWRRDRHPERPRGMAVTSRPDWVCEVLSPATAHPA